MALTMPFDKFSGQFKYVDEAADDHFAILSNKGLRELCNHMLEQHTEDTFKLNVQKFKAELDKGLFFESNIPQGFGLGSSGALVAAIFLRYLEKAGDFKDGLKSMTKEKMGSVKRYLGGLEGFFHGTSSGIDPLSILINEPILLKSANDITCVEVPEFKEDGKNVIFLLNTGLARNTDKLVDKFKASCEDSQFRSKMECELIAATNGSIQSFLDKDDKSLYQNLEQLVKFQFEEMNYLIPNAFNQHVIEGMEHGDYFLKICGSGGGGYMLGFTENWELTQKKLKKDEIEILYRF